MYVWVDALTKRHHRLRLPRREPPLAPTGRRDGTSSANDIIRFHALLAIFPEVRVSHSHKRVCAHGFLFRRGEKCPKSVDMWRSSTSPIIRVDQCGNFFLLREGPVSGRRALYHEAICAAHHCDLANDLGKSRAALAIDYRKALGACCPHTPLPHLNDTDKGDPERGRRHDLRSRELA